MEDTTQRLQEAIAAARSGQLAEARGIAEELTEADPQNAHAWFLRSVLAQDEGQQLEYLNRTLEIDPEHKAARKRMQQMQPPVAEETEEEAEVEFEPEAEAAVEREAEEAEPEEDMTMVAESAAFMAAVAASDVDDDDMADEVITETPPMDAFEEATFPEGGAEQTFDDTMIAESPFAEEMAAEDIEVEALFGEEVPEEDEPEPSFGDEDMATVIAAAAVLGEEESLAEEEAAEEVVEEMEETGLSAADLAAASAGATVLDQAGEAWFEEEAGDELWAKVEAEAVPDWLIEDTSAEADETLAGESLDEAFPEAETQAAQEQDLPDWLLDEPDDDWSEAAEVVEEAGAYDEAPATMVSAAVEADEWAEEEEQAAPDDVAKVAPARPKKKSPNRGLEIALILLIIVAVAIVAALVYFLISPPSF